MKMFDLLQYVRFYITDASADRIRSLAPKM